MSHWGAGKAERWGSKGDWGETGCKEGTGAKARGDGLCEGVACIVGWPVVVDDRLGWISYSAEKIHGRRRTEQSH